MGIGADGKSPPILATILASKVSAAELSTAEVLKSSWFCMFVRMLAIRMPALLYKTVLLYKAALFPAAQAGMCKTASFCKKVGAIRFDIRLSSAAFEWLDSLDPNGMNDAVNYSPWQDPHDGPTPHVDPAIDSRIDFWTIIQGCVHKLRQSLIRNGWIKQLAVCRLRRNDAFAGHDYDDRPRLNFTR
jgi:hypothetical protein